MLLPPRREGESKLKISSGASPNMRRGDPNEKEEVRTRLLRLLRLLPLLFLLLLRMMKMVVKTKPIEATRATPNEARRMKNNTGATLSQVSRKNCFADLRYKHLDTASPTWSSK